MNTTETDMARFSELVKALVPEAEIHEGKQFAEITVPPASLLAAAEALKENPDTRCDYLINLTGVDYGTELGVIYHLGSSKHGQIIVLKTKTPERANPVLESVCGIWRTAEFHEREAYDLLGIRFSNHPDLRRLFLDDTWGFPLRKDYVDDTNTAANGEDRE
ncbi:MAG: NADH-quinone oxidoreductase subunit C [Bacteroidales bacterium]|jgi:NADH:ubiquinone oxidoreductase subunit C|nr:NADH-quinone oxidoreductase subunit C [Bacteroidales bacterium]